MSGMTYIHVDCSHDARTRSVVSTSVESLSSITQLGNPPSLRYTALDTAAADVIRCLPVLQDDVLEVVFRHLCGAAKPPEYFSALLT